MQTRKRQVDGEKASWVKGGKGGGIHGWPEEWGVRETGQGGGSQAEGGEGKRTRKD